MIKHFLYSAFFHSLFFLFIYHSLDIKTPLEEPDQLNSNHLVLSTINLPNTNDKPLSQKKEEDKSKDIVSEKKEEPKPVEPVKKEEPKKEEKPKPVEKKKEEAPKPVEKKKEEPKKQEKPKPVEPKKEEKKKPVEKKKEEKPKPIEPPKKEEPKKEEKPKPAEPKKEEPKKEEPKKEEPKKEEPKKEEKAILPEDNKQQNSGSLTEIFNPNQDLENVNLSSREKFNIRSQIQRCYRWAIAQTGKESKIIIKIKVTIDERGFIESNLEEVKDKALYQSNTNFDYNNAIDNVERTIKLCSPLRNLPKDKYEVWSEINLEIGDQI